MLKIRIPLDLFKRNPGMPPGTPVFIGNQKVESVFVHVTDFDENSVVEYEAGGMEDPVVKAEPQGTRWLNICGVHEIPVLEALAERFNLHPLTVEDMANTRLRPKVEEFEGYLYLIVRMIYMDDNHELDTEQVSLVLTGKTVITVQERREDVFEPLRKRIEAGKGRIRYAGSDYLLYAIVDAVVDHYFQVLEHLTVQADALGRNLYDNPQDDVLDEISDLKATVMDVRRDVWPMRELIARLQRDEAGVFSEGTRTYLRDVYDHIMQVMDLLEQLRENLDSMGEQFLSGLSRRMNEVMKTLTIFSTIFLPLTFVAGLYGMNFAYMPELQLHWAYPVTLGVMLCIAIGLFFFFKRKKWM